MDGATLPNCDFLTEALAGLGTAPKSMSPKWFYDEQGSHLFEQITQLPEYYPTRTETAILRDQIDTLAGYVPEGAALIELGSGASVKTRLLLDGIAGISTYRPLDISAQFLQDTAEALQTDYPDIEMRPMVADFMTDIAPAPTLSDRPNVVFFPGSTIGNLTADQAITLLSRVREWPGVTAFILGADLVKSADVLVPAYDDAAGVTGAFNLNMLARMNRELNADFDLNAFEHVALWNMGFSRIEMHLRSTCDQTVTIGGRAITFAAGETIHTENSRKFTPLTLRDMARQAGWRIAELVTDPDNLFAEAVLIPAR